MHKVKNDQAKAAPLDCVVNNYSLATPQKCQCLSAATQKVKRL
jgi:hypothetical protein